MRRLVCLSLLMLSVLTAAPAFAQKKKPAAASKKPLAVSGPVSAESLSGLDLVPNRRNGTFGIRINHRISQPATLRLLDVQTSRYVKTELLEPSAARTRAVQVGRLASGEYKMEVVLPDTVYWKTVRVSRK
jgi:hypothetical protein